MLQQTYTVTTERPYRLLKIQFNMNGPNMWRLIDISSKKLEAKIIKLSFVKSEDQLADILTKVVFSRVFYNFLGKLDIKDIYAPT